MKWSLEEKVIAAIFMAIALLLGLINLVSPKNTTELVKNANQMRYTYDTLVNLTDFVAAMSIAESGRRGYIFTGRPEELKRHQSAVIAMKSELVDIRRELRRDLDQQQRLNQLQNLVSRRIALFEESIALYQRDRSAAAIQLQNSITDRSIVLREQIQLILEAIRNEEDEQLKQSLAGTRESIESRAAIEQLASILSITAIVGVAIVFYWGVKRRQRLQSLEQTLAQERELSELKLRLFSMVSHEFRTPLSVILASSQLLGEILESQISRSDLKNLYRIQTSAKLMNQLLTDILTLTRAEAGKLECRPTSIDIEAFCLNLLDDIQSSGAIVHTFHFDSSGVCGRIVLDEKLLYSIVNNLLQNAIKYSPAGSQVSLTLQCGTEQVLLRVTDEGEGISESDRTFIFDPFFRGQNAGGISGSGLGLAVVQKCAELLHGWVSVESQTGKGTTFVVCIPR